MKEIILLKDHFNEAEILNDFFKSKSLDSRLLDTNNLKTLNLPKSCLICSNKLMEKIGGKSDLLKISRNIGSTNLIVLNSDESKYEIKKDLGGAFLEISCTNVDEVIIEIVFQIISN